MQTQTELAEQSIRFMKLMPVDSELELTLLKGHLLVEEILTEVLRLTIKKDNPVGINITPRMMFTQKLNLCWAMNHDVKDDNFWSSLKMLNNIRNAMAHEVEPQNLDTKIQKFTDSVLPNSGFSLKAYTGHELICSISWLYINLITWMHELKNS